jgi:DNA-binding NarL/FixJ family response regulator
MSALPEPAAPHETKPALYLVPETETTPASSEELADRFSNLGAALLDVCDDEIDRIVRGGHWTNQDKRLWNTYGSLALESLKVKEALLNRKDWTYIQEKPIPEKATKFWQGEGTELKLRPRYGRIIDWTEATFVHFQNRPLAYEDLAKVLYAEEYDSTVYSTLKTRVNSLVSTVGNRERIDSRLSVMDLQLKTLATIYPTGIRKNIRLVAIPAESDISWQDIDETMRPSDDELRELAISLRQAEFVRQQDKIPIQVEEAWQAYEAAKQRFYAKKSQKAETALDKAAEAALDEEYKIRWQSSAEIKAWQADEEVYLRQTETAKANGETDTSDWGLSTNQVAVLQHLPSGETNQEIGQALGISTNTVASYVKSIFQNTRVGSRVEAATLAYNAYKDELPVELSLNLESLAELSPAEKRVLPGLSAGLTNGEIGEQLSISAGTVLSHARNVYSKLGIKRVQTGIFLQEAEAAGLWSPEQESSKSKPEAPNSNGRAGTNSRNGGSRSTYRIGTGEKVNHLAHFRTSTIKALDNIVRALPQYHRPNPGQTFSLSSEVMLKELLERGVITTEQFDTREVDRAAIVAAMVIKAGHDRGFLNGEKLSKGMDIIRQEERKYLERFSKAA